MKNIISKVGETVMVLIEAFIQWVNKWFDGKKIILTQIALALITVMDMYLDYNVISYAWAAFWTGLANLLLKALASGKPIFNTGYKMDTLFFWVNIVWFGVAIADLSVNTGILNGQWNLAIATVLITLRMIGLNQSSTYKTGNRL